MNEVDTGLLGDVHELDGGQSVGLDFGRPYRGHSLDDRRFGWRSATSDESEQQTCQAQDLRESLDTIERHSPFSGAGAAFEAVVEAGVDDWEAVVPAGGSIPGAPGRCSEWITMDWAF